MFGRLVFMSFCPKTHSPSSLSISMSCIADRCGVVLRCAAVSRLVLLSLILLWRTLLNPYDTSALLNPSCLSSPTLGAPARPLLWPSAASAIEGSVVWDSVYFLRISQCGYEYEQTYAFLPLLPISISVLSRTVFAPLIPLIGHRAVLGLSGYVLNNVTFVLAAVYFYRLSVIILKDPEAALHASILFCFNPASIFYSSIYTESLYSLFSIGGMYHLVSGADNIAMLCFALSSSARSNGILNAGYFCYQTMHKSYDAIIVQRRPSLAVQILIAGALRCLCIFAPLVAFQAYGYYNICVGRYSDEMRPWCKARPPFLYNYIQSHYWGIGFLRYFQLKQLPNFLLATPVLSLAFFSIVHYVKTRPEIVLSLSFCSSVENKSTAAPFSSVAVPGPNSGHFSDKSSSEVYQDYFLTQRKQKIRGKDPVPLPSENGSSVQQGYFSVTVLPFILHMGFMVVTAFFVMHVQVATRFLSASPPLYWFASYLMVSPDYGKRWGYFIWVYCGAYILLGSLLFSNFYPFT